MEVSEDLCFISSRWWFQICLFSPLPGEMIQINKCFSNGLVQPPPSLGYHTQQRVFFVYSVQFLRVTVARKKNPWCFSVGENRETGKGGGASDAGKSRGEVDLLWCSGFVDLYPSHWRGWGAGWINFSGKFPFWWGEPDWSPRERTIFCAGMLRQIGGEESSEYRHRKIPEEPQME